MPSDSAIGGLLLRDQADGTNLGLWGGYTDDNLTILERPLMQLESYTVSASATITWTVYAKTNLLMGANVLLTGPSGSQSLTAAATITMPAYRNNMNVWNDTGQAITFTVSGGTAVVIQNNMYARIASDGTNHYIYTPSQFAGGLYVNGKIQNLTAGVAGGDAINKTQLNEAIAAAGSSATAGTAKVDSLAAAHFIIDLLTAGIGITITDNGDTMALSVNLLTITQPSTLPLGSRTHFLAHA